MLFLRDMQLLDRVAQRLDGLRQFLDASSIGSKRRGCRRATVPNSRSPPPASMVMSTGSTNEIVRSGTSGWLDVQLTSDPLDRQYLVEGPS
jgi:hypothetical protein